jgi:hypothetical protein
MNDLASEFFWSAISHVPPGLLIIALYWRTEAENVFRAHRTLFASPLLFIACLLVIAWCFGLILEAIVFVPSKLALTICVSEKRLEWFRQTWTYKKVEKQALWLHRLLLGEPTPTSQERLLPLEDRVAELEKQRAFMREENEILRSLLKLRQSQTAADVLGREKRREGYLRFSIMIMSRGLAVIFFVASLGSFFTRLIKPAHPYPLTPEPFSNLQWTGLHSFCCFCLLCVTWWQFRNRGPIPDSKEV